MSKNDEYSAAYAALLDAPVAYHPAMARLCGGVNAGVMLAQFLYWRRIKMSRYEGEEWFWETQAEIEFRTALSDKEQLTARKKLVERGVLEERFEGLPRKLLFRVNVERLAEILAGGTDPVEPPERGEKGRFTPAGGQSNHNLPCGDTVNSAREIQGSPLRSSIICSSESSSESSLLEDPKNLSEGARQSSKYMAPSEKSSRSPREGLLEAIDRDLEARGMSKADDQARPSPVADAPSPDVGAAMKAGEALFAAVVRACGYALPVKKAHQGKVNHAVAVCLELEFSPEDIDKCVKLRGNAPDPFKLVNTLEKDREEDEKTRRELEIENSRRWREVERMNARKRGEVVT